MVSEDLSFELKSLKLKNNNSKDNLFIIKWLLLTQADSTIRNKLWTYSKLKF